MKAYKVSIYNDIYSTVVFAESPSKAKARILGDDGYDECEYTDLRAIRLPEADKYYQEGKWCLNWYNDEDQIIMVRDLGYKCYDPIDWECEDCPASQWCGTFQAKIDAELDIRKDEAVDYD